MFLELGDGTKVHINVGPKMVESKRESQGVKWCFKCRARQEFWLIIRHPAEPSYYGPDATIACGECDTSDGDLFPGIVREWE